MTDSEIRQLIKETIRHELTQIMMGLVNSNQSNQRSTIQRFKTDGPIPNARSIQPFGVSSRAPKDTDSVIAGVGGDVTHLIMLGHFDKNKPETEDGETILYDAYGHIIYLSQDKIQIGSKSSDENLVLGQVFKELAKQWLQIDSEHDHIGNMGYKTSPPTQAADYLDLKASPVEDELVLSDVSFTEKG